MIQRNDLATKALKSAMTDGGFEPQKKASSLTRDNDTTVRSALKRSRSSISGSFDMGEFMKASEQVEESISFPAVEWPSLDELDNGYDDENSFNIQLSMSGDDENEDEDDDCFHIRSPRKRQCRGLIRCTRSCNLSSLWKLSSTSQRRGSNGSLS